MGASLTHRQALLVLNAHSGLGPVSRRRLLEAFDGDPVAVLEASEPTLRQVEGIGPERARAVVEWPQYFDLEREERRMAEFGMVLMVADDADYPPLLREIYDPPVGLYCLGPVRPKEKTVALVGTRHASMYGQSVAKRLASDLARMGFCVVSGMARGIDTAAHRGALDVGGETVAVLGCGADLIYPPENLDLYRELSRSGAIFSELPLGTSATKKTFPMRNRVVSGICRAVVVVESANKGGSMITARFAGEHGRALLAVPGRIDQETSRGCHQLIRDGAVLCGSVDDILEELAFAPPQGQLPLGLGEGGSDGEAASNSADWAEGLGDDERTVLACLREGDRLSADRLTAATGLPVSQVNSALVLLELKRRLVKRADGTFEAR